MRIITEAFDELGETWVYFDGTDTSYDQMNTAIAQLKNAIDVFAARRVPSGYTEEELEEDSPYNQWMYEK
jgi:hypothetical protein